MSDCSALSPKLSTPEQMEIAYGQKAKQRPAQILGVEPYTISVNPKCFAQVSHLALSAAAALSKGWLQVGPKP